MKKIISLVLVIILIIAVSTILNSIESRISNAYNSGFEAGLRHVIEDAELWVEIHNGIVEILIDIDGDIYVHEAEGGEF